MDIDKMMAFLGGTEDRDEYLLESLPRLEAVNSAKEFMEYCLELRENVEEDDEVPTVQESKSHDESAYEKLQAYAYPADFMDWHRQFGNFYLWLGTTKVITTSEIIEELENDWYSLLTLNGWLILTLDASGNAFVLDPRKDSPTIKFADHNSIVTQQSALSDLYAEHFELEWQAGNMVVANPQNLDLNLIWDANGDFSPTSPYIRQYLADHLSDTGVTEFLSFIKQKLKEGILDNYVLEES